MKPPSRASTVHGGREAAHWQQRCGSYPQPPALGRKTALLAKRAPTATQLSIVAPDPNTVLPAPVTARTASTASTAAPPNADATSAASAAAVVTASTAAVVTASAAAVAASAAAAVVTASAAVARLRRLATASAAVANKLYAGLGCSDIFLVKDIERRQADVRDFLFAESDFVRCRPNGCSRCAAHHRQGQPGCPQQRHGACSTLSLRRFLRARHVESSHTFGGAQG